MTSRTRTYLLFGAVCAVCVAAVVYQKSGRQEYTAILPPDTVHLRSPVIDSIGRVVARCFGEPASVLREVLWFTSDSSLGRNRRGKELRGRAYIEARAAVLKTQWTGDTEMIDHEWRHLVTRRLHTEWNEAPEIFQKVCK